MSKVLVNENHLTDIAIAIRNKNGTSDKYKPSQMASAIDNISCDGETIITGFTVDDIATRDISGDITITSNIIKDYAFSNTNITSVSCNTIENFSSIKQGAFKGCTSLENINITPSIIDSNDLLSVDLFSGCTSLEEVELNNRGFENNVFAGCTNLKRAIFPYAIYANQYVFSNCTNLEYFDMGRLATATTNLYFMGYTFSKCSNLKTVVIRNKVMVNLGHINCFTDTPFASDGIGGILYVPQSLIESYQANSNWSIILGYANNNIVAIEGSEYE